MGDASGARSHGAAVVAAAVLALALVPSPAPAAGGGIASSSELGHARPMPDFSLFCDEHVREYEATGGKVGHDWNGTACLILRTKGRRSGETRKFPLIYGRDGRDYLLVASKGGAPENPGWYRNLVAPDPARVHGATPDASRGPVNQPTAGDGCQLIGPEAIRAVLPVGVRPVNHGRDRSPAATHPSRRSRLRISRGGMPSVSMTSTAMRWKSSYEVIFNCSTPWAATRGLA